MYRDGAYLSVGHDTRTDLRKEATTNKMTTKSEELIWLGRTPNDDTPIPEPADFQRSPPASNTLGKEAAPPSVWFEGEEPSTAPKNGRDDPDDEADIGSACYPPLLDDIEVLGYIKDKNGISYSRDIGRSAIIHDEVFFIFGDTFCNNALGEFVGITSNTIAYVENRAKPLESQYGEISSDGMVKAFVPFSKKENELEPQRPGSRTIFRMFGGVADVGVVGIVWFQKLIKWDNGREEYRGVGQARLSLYSDCRIIVERLPPLLFGPNEPRIGSFSTLVHKDHVYLWGDRPDGEIILARVKRFQTALREEYEYWNGKGWVPRWHEAVPVLHNIQHGAIIHTELFGKNMPFVFVGVNKSGDSMVQIGAASNVHGPFDLTPVFEAQGLDNNTNYKYCIYPHLFASNIPKRELFITWSEHFPGGVIAAKLKFRIDEVKAADEAMDRKWAAEQQEARRLASITEEEQAKAERRELLKDPEKRNAYIEEMDDDPRPKRDRSEGRLKDGYILSFIRTSADPPPPSPPRPPRRY